MSGTSVSQRHIDALGAIARFRYQRRSSRGWLVGDRRISAAAISRLEHKSLVKEIAFSGEPTLVLTQDGKRLLAERLPRS
jgi:hypothetical protein